MACPGCLSECMGDLRVNVRPLSTETTAEGVFTKTILIAEAGTFIPQHSHASAHLTVVVSGRVRVWAADDYLGEWQAMSSVLIPAHIMHTFQSLEPNTTLLCVHDVSRQPVTVLAENVIPLVA